MTPPDFDGMPLQMIRLPPGPRVRQRGYIFWTMLTVVFLILMGVGIAFGSHTVR